MKKRFTAEEARTLAGRSLEEKVDLLLETIKERATSKNRTLKTGWQYEEDKDLWIQGGYKTSEEWKEAKAILEGLGFKVSFYYKESQFVDMYTLIEW